VVPSDLAPTATRAFFIVRLLRSHHAERDAACLKETTATSGGW
jgi:hypothetical protein